MGMFDFFLSEEKKIAKHTRRLTNRDAQPEDREASAIWLANTGNPQAVMGLLSRFDMNLDHELKNQVEKDFIYGVLRDLGEAAVEPTRVWLRQCKGMARPLALLGALKGPEASLDAAYEMLKIEIGRDEFKPQKKKAILIWLAARKEKVDLDQVLPFIPDFDEGVRYAAAEVLIAQNTPDARLPLLTQMVNPDEDSNRVRIRVAEVFVQRRWSVQEHAEALVEALPDRFSVHEGRLVG
ncbi:MAG: hypothetical protein ACI9MC_001883 [Kiritimatiellia bacterium]|jgi:hypothetical protein